MPQYRGKYSLVWNRKRCQIKRG